MMYSIVDIETTGKTNRITEISIFKYNGKKVIDEFTTLVNPECPIPNHITTLTGIDEFTVANAPTFKAIAEKIMDFTANTIFVAHNVNFDFNVIKNELKRLNLKFTRKKLCTIRLSRKLLPGYNSYSLGKLCKSLDINLKDRHRARGDAEATVALFKLILQQEASEEVIANFLKNNSRQGTLPSNLPKQDVETLPEKPGIYYFRNKKNKIIYIGKAKNIKKRVLSHFYDKKQKELDICRETASITFELSGSELIALLMEDAAIKKHYPKYNVVSKKTARAYAILNYTDRKGIIHFAVNTLKATPNPLTIVYSKQDALSYLEKLCDKFELCPKFCHLNQNPKQCNHYKIKSCKGICIEKESVALYNSKVKQARKHIEKKHQNLIIKQAGRNPREEGFIQVKNGIYQGFGFVNNENLVVNESELEAYLIPQKNNHDIERILKKVFLLNNS